MRWNFAILAAIVLAALYGAYARWNSARIESAFMARMPMSLPSPAETSRLGFHVLGLVITAIESSRAEKLREVQSLETGHAGERNGGRSEPLTS